MSSTTIATTTATTTNQVPSSSSTVPNMLGGANGKPDRYWEFSPSWSCSIPKTTMDCTASVASTR